MSNNLGKILKQQRELYGLQKRLPREVGQIAVNFTKDNFKRGAFSGERAWPPRKPQPGRKERKGRRALLVKTGALRRSIRVLKVGRNYVEIGSKLDYARIHNEGGTVTQTIKITPKMRKFFWAMYYQNGKDEKWKAMALKKGSIRRTVSIPQRKFLGRSRRMDALIEQHIRKSLIQILK